MRVFLAFLGLFVLSGCATTRYVVRDCLTTEQYDELRRAEPPKVTDKLTGRADEDIKPIAGSAIRLRSWGHGLLNVLEGCRAK